MSEFIEVRKVNAEPTDNFGSNVLYFIDMGGGFFTIKISSKDASMLQTLYVGGGGGVVLPETYDFTDFLYNESNVLYGVNITHQNGSIEYRYTYDALDRIDQIAVQDNRVPESFSLQFEYNGPDGAISRIYKFQPNQ